MFSTRVLRASAKSLGECAATEGEAKKQMERWTKISLAMLALTGAVGAIEWISHLEDHDPHRHQEHTHQDTPHYAYLKIRNKPYPWHYSNCDLLDFHCTELARAAEKALKKSEGKQ